MAPTFNGRSGQRSRKTGVGKVNRVSKGEKSLIYTHKLFMYNQTLSFSPLTSSSLHSTSELALPLQSTALVQLSSSPIWATATPPNYP